jgi:hypothetical protein
MKLKPHETRYAEDTMSDLRKHPELKQRLIKSITTLERIDAKFFARDIAMNQSILALHDQETERAKAEVC